MKECIEMKLKDEQRSNMQITRVWWWDWYYHEAQRPTL